jgi:hypothetical protein
MFSTACLASLNNLSSISDCSPSGVDFIINQFNVSKSALLSAHISKIAQELGNNSNVEIRKKLFSSGQWCSACCLAGTQVEPITTLAINAAQPESSLQCYVNFADSDLRTLVSFYNEVSNAASSWLHPFPGAIASNAVMRR